MIVTCSTHGHTIQIKSRWLGIREIIYYDGLEVASGLTLFGGQYGFASKRKGNPWTTMLGYEQSWRASR